MIGSKLLLAKKDMGQQVHMRTGWWMPFVFCIDDNHDFIPIKHHRWGHL